MPTVDLDEPPTVTYFLVLLLADHNYASEPEYREAHFAFIDEMDVAGVILLGGAFGSSIEGALAAYVLHVPSQEAAESWALRDPLIANEVCRPHIVPWHLVGISRVAIDVAFGS